jgi:hypothetical protein
MHRLTSNIHVDLDIPAKKQMRIIMTANIRMPGDTPNSIREHIINLDASIKGDFDPMVWPAARALERLRKEYDLPLTSGVILTTGCVKHPWHKRLFRRGPSKAVLKAMHDTLSTHIL